MLNTVNNESTATTDCRNCPLLASDHFRTFSDDELAYVRDFKTGELSVEAGATILLEGMHSAHLFTILDGWAFRYKTLEDGRRQILNYGLPGDLVGLQGSLMDEMQHSIEALTPVTLCVFERARLFELYKRHPGLAYDVTWLASREEQMLDDNLLSVGRRSALERAAYLFSFIHRRASATRQLGGNRKAIPLTQQHVADTLGLSIVHTNRTLRKLVACNAIRWLDRGCEVLDIDALGEIAGWEYQPTANRPFI